MSFQDVFRDLEAGLPPPPQAVVAHCVFQINTKVSALRRLADALAAGDARALRERLRRARAEVTRLARNTARRLADPAAAAAVGPGLAMEFQAALGEFQRVQARIIEADRQETAAARRARPPTMLRPPSPPGCYDAAAAAAAAGGVAEGQELALLDDEIAFNEALVEEREREREICKIQQEISEINEIFRDLAKLVHNQQGDIDVVESNIETAAMETSKAAEQLSEAEATQASTKCLLFTVLGLVMFIFVLVLVS
ncbi:hypothetical protein BS78_10G093100 [Paspalum vaginatum]|nr:hypothetical protein BS78_10G093100 [Paspalum vaginatum]